MDYRRQQRSVGMFRERLESDGSVASRSSEASGDYPDLLLNGEYRNDFNALTSQRGERFEKYISANRSYSPQALVMKNVIMSLSMPEEKLHNAFLPPLVSDFYKNIRQSLRTILSLNEVKEEEMSSQSEQLLKSVVPVLEAASPFILRPNIFNLNPSVMEELFAGVSRLSLEVSSIRALYTTNPGQFIKPSEVQDPECFQAGLNSLYLGEVISLSQMTNQKLTGSVCVEHPFNLARLYCGKCNRTVCVLCCLKVVGKHSHHIVTKKTNMNRTRAEIILKMVAILNDLIQLSINAVDAPLHVQLFVHFFNIPLFDTSKLKLVSNDLLTLLGMLNWFIVYTNMMTVGPPNAMDDFATILQNFSTVFKTVLRC